jgi:spermidine synthase
VDGSSVAKIIQGPTMTLQILRTDRFGEAASWRLLSDSYSMTGTNHYSLRYMQLFAWLPLALQPESRRALLISYGAGNTAQALLSAPGLTELTVVDVSPEMLAASRLIHGARDPLADPRVRLVLEDGRHYLRTRGEQFDIITGEPPPPIMAGVVNLYTREYFMALKERLAPGGLATYWLPVVQLEPSGARAIIAAFCGAFPDCTLWVGTRSNWILMGGRGFANRPRAGHLARLWQHPASASSLAAGGFEHPAQLGATFLADSAQLRGWTSGTLVLTDDYPKRLAPVPGLLQPKMDEYDPWLQPETARRHFESSRWVAAHWPAELYQESLRYFQAQPALNANTSPDPVDNLPMVDRLLRDSDLRTPILWLLGSDVTEQQILDRRLAEGARPHDRPDYTYALGARALAERDYAQAAELFGQLAEHQSERFGALAAYTMCRAGQRKRAAAVRGAHLLAPELRCWASP